MRRGDTALACEPCKTGGGMYLAGRSTGRGADLQGQPDIKKPLTALVNYLKHLWCVAIYPLRCCESMRKNHLSFDQRGKVSASLTLMQWSK